MSLCGVYYISMDAHIARVRLSKQISCPKMGFAWSWHGSLRFDVFFKRQVLGGVEKMEWFSKLYSQSPLSHLLSLSVFGITNKQELNICTCFVRMPSLFKLYARKIRSNTIYGDSAHKERFQTVHSIEFHKSIVIRSYSWKFHNAQFIIAQAYYLCPFLNAFITQKSAFRYRIRN